MHRRVARPSNLTLMTVLLAAALVAVGCSGADGGEVPVAEEPTAQGAVLVIEGFAFDDITVGPGDEIVADNRDSAPHTVTGDGFDVRVGGGQQATFTAPANPGNYDFVCSIHPTMAGVLTVG